MMILIQKTTLMTQNILIMIIHNKIRKRYQKVNYENWLVKKNEKNVKLHEPNERENVKKQERNYWKIFLKTVKIKRIKQAVLMITKLSLLSKRMKNLS